MARMPLLAAALLLIGGIGVGGLYLYRSNQDQVTAVATSDSRQIAANIKVGGDSWIGYTPIGSNALQGALRQDGITLQYVSDGGDYATRMKQIRDGELDMAVVTVDANLLNTPDFNRGGVIVAVIDQSTGGDALVCDHTKITKVDEFSHTSNWKVAFTPDSPSHHLLRAIGNDFGVGSLLKEGDWSVETDGSAKALEALKSGTVDCAVLWQPDVFRALKGSNSLGVVYSSADADGLIVDVLMVHRPHLLESSTIRPYIQTVVRRYFETLKRFSDDEMIRLSEAKSFLREQDGGRYTDDEVKSMLKGVTWVNLTENAQSWFGVGGKNRYYKLEEAHDFARTIIRAEKGPDFMKFFRAVSIIDGRFLKPLYEEQEIDEHNSTITDPLELKFPTLSELQWNALATQGTLRSRRVVFRPGELVLEDTARTALGEAMEDFKRYPKSRLEIQVGYPVSAGDDAIANAKTRATATLQYLVGTYHLDENRVRVYVPEPDKVPVVIPRREGEGGRSYGSRLREVRLVLRREQPQS